jgi:PIN domain nuclease of toxin-antitoxin system
VKPTLILDTCAFLDLVAERWTASRVISTFKEAQHPVILSITVWEISRKLGLGKLDLPCEQTGVLSFVREVCDHYSISILPVSDVICHEAELMPLHHRDPFDRMILAATKVAGCAVVTTDRNFELYDVKVLTQR